MIKTGTEEYDLLLESALYEPDAAKRDQARGTLARESGPDALYMLCDLLNAPQRMTRRRVARILSEVEPKRALPVLRDVICNQEKPTRTRIEVARILSVLSDSTEEALAIAHRSPDLNLKRACLTSATPRPTLDEALLDVTLADRAADVLETMGETLTQEVATAILDQNTEINGALARLAFAACPNHPQILKSALKGVSAALDVVQDNDVLISLALCSNPVLAKQAQLRRIAVGYDLEMYINHSDPDLRAQVARMLPPTDDRLIQLASDPDPRVRWVALHAGQGDYTEAMKKVRTAPHARLEAVSAQPPYGIHESDLAELKRPEPFNAALALCHTRFDINLGVSVRSAEAAGLKEVFILGKEELFKSPMRGTDLVLPCTHVSDARELIRIARSRGYQIVCVQQTPASVNYLKADYPPNPLFVMGAEDLGVPPELRAEADLLVEIPLFGVIDSLNVAAAATSVLFYWAGSRHS